MTCAAANDGVQANATKAAVKAMARRNEANQINELGMSRMVKCVFEWCVFIMVSQCRGGRSVSAGRVGAHRSGNG